MTATEATPGTPVVLDCPDNPRLHGAAGVVTAVEPWGCHVRTQAAATGTYRAGWAEMTAPAPPPARSPGRDQGYTGDVCGRCGSAAVRRNGACLLCDACGETSGCS